MTYIQLFCIYFLTTIKESEEKVVSWNSTQNPRSPFCPPHQSYGSCLEWGISSSQIWIKVWKKLYLPCCLLIHALESSLLELLVPKTLFLLYIVNFFYFFFNTLVHLVVVVVVLLEGASYANSTKGVYGFHSFILAINLNHPLKASASNPAAVSILLQNPEIYNH